MDLEEPDIGGAVVAMKGKKCVAIAADHRHGGSHTISMNKDKLFMFGNHLYLGITGLPGDARKVVKKLRFRANICEFTEEKKITPTKLSGILRTILYERRFGPYFALPIIAGLHTDTWEPYICSMDVIGCQNYGEGYVTAGSCNEQLLGMCHVLWQPNLGPKDLFQTISQTLISSCEDDPMSGCGGTVYILEKDKLTIKTLRTRMD